MKFLVKYVDYHSDNYQGGSGQSFEFTRLIELPGNTKCADIFSLLEVKVLDIAKSSRPFSVNYDANPAILNIEFFP